MHLSVLHCPKCDAFKLFSPQRPSAACTVGVYIDSHFVVAALTGLGGYICLRPIEFGLKCKQYFILSLGWDGYWCSFYTVSQVRSQMNREDPRSRNCRLNHSRYSGSGSQQYPGTQDPWGPPPDEAGFIHFAHFAPSLNPNLSWVGGCLPMRRTVLGWLHHFAQFAHSLDRILFYDELSS
jgi:hypothetical protein